MPLMLLNPAEVFAKPAVEATAPERRSRFPTMRASHTSRPKGEQGGRCAYASEGGARPGPAHVCAPALWLCDRTGVAEIAVLELMR